MQAFGVLDRYIGKTISQHHHDDPVHAGVALRHYQVCRSAEKVRAGQLRCAGRWSLHHPQRAEGHPDLLSRWRRCLARCWGWGCWPSAANWVVMQASGFTRLQVALAVMKTAIPLVLLTMAIGEWVAPQGEQMARNYRAQQMYGGSLLSTSSRGCGRKMAHNFVYIERVKGNDELGASASVPSTRSVVYSRCAMPLRQNSIAKIKCGVCRRWMNPT